MHINIVFLGKSMQFKCSTDRNIALIQPINWPSKPIILALLKSSKRGAKTRFLLSKFTFRYNQFVHSIANIKKSRGKLQRAYQQNHTECKKQSSKTSQVKQMFYGHFLIVASAKQRCTCSSFCSR